MGKVLIIGRKTHESIGRVLPGRTTVIVSGQKDYQVPGAHVVSSFEAALKFAQTIGGEIMIGGGGDIFLQAIEKADCMYLSIIHADFDGDTYFPEWSSDTFHEVSRKEIDAVIPYSFVVYERIRR